MNELDDNTPTKHDRVALGWFALGALVGAVATIGILTLVGMLRPGGTSTAGPIDLQAIREAARQGAQDALIANGDRISASIQLNDIREAAKEGAQAALQGQAPVDTNADANNLAAVDPGTVQNMTFRPNNTQGNANAPVTIVEYSDFQCPFCKRFHDQVLQNILDQYVKTGKVRFSYKNYPFLGDESKWAAEAAECAADQNRFWDYHQLLFSRQAGENAGIFTKEKLLGYAVELKLDNAKFTQCLNGDQTLTRVEADANEGNKLGVRGTPAFLINGKLLVGAQPFEAFRTAIEDALKGK